MRSFDLPGCSPVNRRAGSIAARSGPPVNCARAKVAARRKGRVNRAMAGSGARAQGSTRGLPPGEVIVHAFTIAPPECLRRSAPVPCYECRRPNGALRFRCKACRKDFSLTSGTLFAFHKRSSASTINSPTPWARGCTRTGPKGSSRGCVGRRSATTTSPGLTWPATPRRAPATHAIVETAALAYPGQAMQETTRDEHDGGDERRNAQDRADTGPLNHSPPEDRVEDAGEAARPREPAAQRQPHGAAAP
jgi:hypothetical protein